MRSWTSPAVKASQEGELASLGFAIEPWKNSAEAKEAAREWTKHKRAAKSPEYQAKRFRTNRLARVKALYNMASKRRKGATLKRADLEALARSDVCAVTGLRLEWDTVRSPRSPSLDRILNSVGYHPGNVRVVCLMTNYGMNKFGADAFRQFIRDANDLMQSGDPCPKQSE